MFEVGAGGWLAIISAITGIQTIIAAILGGFITARLQRQAREGEEAIERAKTAHNESTMRMIREARSTRNEVSSVGRVAEETLGVARITQEILNGDHTKLLESRAKFADRIAKDHPEDKDAQVDAVSAREDYERAAANKKRG